MAEPPTDDINLDAGFQQMNRRGVSKYVRENSLRLAVGTVLDYWFSVSPHEFVNTKSCQGTSLTRGENRVLAAGAGHLIQKTTQERRSLGPTADNRAACCPSHADAPVGVDRAQDSRSEARRPLAHAHQCCKEEQL